MGLMSQHQGAAQKGISWLTQKYSEQPTYTAREGVGKCSQYGIILHANERLYLHQSHYSPFRCNDHVCTNHKPSSRPTGNIDPLA